MSESPLRIIFVINSMGRGGAEVQVRDLAIQLVAQRHHVRVVVLMEIEEFDDVLRDHGVEVESYGMRKGRPEWRAVGLLRKTIAEFRPDVVHAHQFSSGILARLAVVGRRRGRPLVVCSVHTRYESSRLRYAGYRLTNPLGDVFTGVSHAAIAEHESHHAARGGSMLHVPNGIDLGPWGSGDRGRVRDEFACGERFVWLAIGSFRDDLKDFSTLLRAFAAAAPHDAVLLIAGAGKLLEDKRAEARALGVTGRVKFLGLRHDIPDLMAGCDGFVLSSTSEAMPIVLLEAHASRRPIVATRVGDVAEVVRDGISGYLVTPRDASGLAAAMTKLTSMSSRERAMLGDAGYAHVEQQFSLAAIVDRWVQVYRVEMRKHGG